MVTLNSKERCARQGCATRPSFGVEGCGTTQFCIRHANEGMVHLRKRKRKRCALEGCDKNPTYGLKGSKTAEFYVPHAKKGVCPVFKKKTCAHQGCVKTPSYGMEGSKMAELCTSHAKEGMVRVKMKTCALLDCNMYPSHGEEGSFIRKFCTKHAEDGMISLAGVRGLPRGRRGRDKQRYASPAVDGIADHDGPAKKDKNCPLPSPQEIKSSAFKRRRGSNLLVRQTVVTPAIPSASPATASNALVEGGSPRRGLMFGVSNWRCRKNINGDLSAQTVECTKARPTKQYRMYLHGWT